MRRSSLLVAVIVAMSVLFSASSAFALMEDPNFQVQATSTYNPAIGNDVYWRWQWGNVLEPDVTFTAIPSDTKEDLWTLGFLSAADERQPTDGFVYEMRQLDTFGDWGVVPIPTPGSSSVTFRKLDGVFGDTLKSLRVGASTSPGCRTSGAGSLMPLTPTRPRKGKAFGAGVFDSGTSSGPKMPLLVDACTSALT